MPNIIVSLSAKYKSVAKIFFEQIQKHFKCDNLDVYVVSDEDFDIDYPIKDKYINNQKSIPGRIFELVNKIGDNDYLCFLADALACADVSEDAINSIINEFREKGIEYCNLIPKEIKNHKMEEIKRTLRYGVSFIAFYATKGFILREFSGNVSDYDFEEKYLKIL